MSLFFFYLLPFMVNKDEYIFSSADTARRDNPNIHLLIPALYKSFVYLPNLLTNFLSSLLICFLAYLLR